MIAHPYTVTFLFTRDFFIIIDFVLLIHSYCLLSGCGHRYQQYDHRSCFHIIKGDSYFENTKLVNSVTKKVGK